MKKTKQSSDAGRVRLERRVRLRCSHHKCPRTRLIPFDAGMPDGTSTVVTPCPWHAGDTSSEDYYDAKGRWWGSDGWEEQSNAQMRGNEI